MPLDYGPSRDPIWVMTDACGNGIGGVIAQGPDWKTSRVAAFYSAKMSSAQRNYPVHEQELLAGVETMLRHGDISWTRRSSQAARHVGSKNYQDSTSRRSMSLGWITSSPTHYPACTSLTNLAPYGRLVNTSVCGPGSPSDDPPRQIQNYHPWYAIDQTPGNW